MYKKGQVSNFDLVIAMSIFIFILFVMVGTWDEISRKIYHYEDRRSTYYKGLDITDILIKTTGNPTNWDRLDTIDSSTVFAIGFASKPNVLDEDKIEKFESLEYGEMKDILGLSKEDFNLVIHNIGGSDEILLYSFGDGLNKSHVRIDRYAILDEDLVRLSLKLYY